MTSTQVKKIILEQGADLCGIANIERFREAPEGFHLSDVLPSCKSVIVFAKMFLRSTLRCNTQIPYTIVRNILSDKLDNMSVDICTEFERAGYEAVPTGTIGPTEFDAKTNRYRNIVSAKHCAELAGLGRIGKNTLLITPEYGNMVWLNVILTNMELEQDTMTNQPSCPPGCSLCENACPVNALGKPEMNQLDCWNYAFGEENGGEWRIKCNRCRTICPFCYGTKNSPQT